MFSGAAELCGIALTKAPFPMKKSERGHRGRESLGYVSPVISFTFSPA
jgi:hypothetical protein